MSEGQYRRIAVHRTHCTGGVSTNGSPAEVYSYSYVGRKRYIEAFDSIQQRELIDRFTFSGFYDAKQYIEKYMYSYNHVGWYGAIGWMTPIQKWEQGLSWMTVRQPTAPASAHLSRPDRAYALRAASASYSLDKTDETGYLRLNGNQDNNSLVANHFQKNVQILRGLR